VIWSEDDNRLRVSRQPQWLQRAFETKGQCDIPDAPVPPRVVLWWPQLLASWWGDARADVSGRLVAYALDRAGMAIPRTWWRLRPWINWGFSITVPATGAVVVVRSQGGGFVGFIAGPADAAGRLPVLCWLAGRPVELIPVKPDYITAMSWPSERSSVVSQYALPWT
jgi:hypothetical protein